MEPTKCKKHSSQSSEHYLTIGYFLQSIISFQGGIEAFICRMTAGAISSYSDIADDTIISEGPAIYLNRLRAIAGSEDVSFTSFLVSYLEGSGVPCPAESQDLRNQGLVDYSDEDVNSPRFRPWAFYRACTGLNEVTVTKPAKVSLFNFIAESSLCIILTVYNI